MVKNQLGGNKSKKFGRKFIATKGSNKLRFAEDEDETYACVSKLLGNGMCHVLCSDDKQRLCIIRNKFRGRGKRDNTLRPGVFVIVGKRSWETAKDTSIEKCDLIEVYSENEIKKIKEEVSINWSIFRTIENMKFGSHALNEDEDDGGFEFTNKVENVELEEEIKKQMETEETKDVFLDDDENFDIDDI